MNALKEELRVLHEVNADDEKELQDLADYLVDWYRKSMDCEKADLMGRE